MKKILLIIIYLFITGFGIGQDCDRYFPTHISYDNDYLNLHLDNFSTGNYYSIFHRTTPGESVNTSTSVIDIKKPIIVIEGFDIFNTESCSDIYRHYFNFGRLGDHLRSLGYDVITFNLSFPMEAIQINALIFAKFIDYINKCKTGDEELIIMGVSMGGLITRYALTYMEEHGMQHQTKLFLSFDSPQKGGIAPLSIQALLLDEEAGLGSIFDSRLAYLINCFNSRGPRQMLTSQVANINDGYADPFLEHPMFYNELNTMNSCGGFPINCKSVAIANGSLNGETQDGGGNAFGQISGNPAIILQINLGIFTYYKTLTTVPGIDNWALSEGRCVYQGLENCNSDHGFYIAEDGMPLDHVPGGYYPWYNEVAESLSGVNGISLQCNSRNSTFVSTVSALALNTNHLMLDVGSYSKTQVLQDTYFDDIWWNLSHLNMEHTSYNDDLKTFVTDQILLSETETYAQLNNYVSGYNLYSGAKKLYKASNTVAVSNCTIKNGEQLTLKSGNVIRFDGEFTVELGAELSASPETIKTRNCNLAGNLLTF